MYRKSGTMSDMQTPPRKKPKRKLVLGKNEDFQSATPSTPSETEAGELVLPVDTALPVRADTGMSESLFNPICIGFFRATQNVKPKFPPELKLNLASPDKTNESKDNENLHKLVNECAMEGSVRLM